MRKKKCEIKKAVIDVKGHPFEYEYCKTHIITIDSLLANDKFPDCVIIKGK